jgi:hypothetical protein
MTNIAGCSMSRGPSDHHPFRTRVSDHIGATFVFHDARTHDVVPSHDAMSRLIDASVPSDLAAIDPARVALDNEATPSAHCRLDRPAGDCDRCPEHACLQVLVQHSASDAEWTSFCDAGNVREEALIACICAGGNERACRSSAMDTERALLIVANVFGGEVPRIGERYRDSNGLKQVIGVNEQQWLALRTAAPPTMRCDAPDIDTAETHYASCARGMRMRQLR